MKSIFGLNQNIVAALSYLLGPLSGIIVLVLERENKYVRFHALQATLWFLFLWVIFWVVWVLGGLPLLGLLIRVVTWPVMWLWRLILVGTKFFLMFRAGTGSEFRLPFVGDVAWSQVNK